MINKETIIREFLEKAPVRNPKVEKAIRFLETKLSPEGFKVLVLFMWRRAKGGWNRDNHILTLAEVFDTNFEYIDPYLIKSNLRSYKNTDLYGLIETGDLVKVGRKLIPKKT